MAVATADQARALVQRGAQTRPGGRRSSWRRQLVLQILCLIVTATVLFPILWIFSLALDPRNLSRPDSLIPPGASLESFARVLAHPTDDPIDFLGLALNSFKLAAGISIFTCLFGILAAYPLSRFKFGLREAVMIAILGVLMLPAVATLAPLFVMLNGVRLDLPALGTFNLRQSLLGVGLAVISGQLPFAIWNLKGYLDTIPKELEEAAAVDGATRTQTFTSVVLPLALPALAVTAFLSFVTGWTEFYFVSIFLNNANDFTLSLALNKMVGAFGQTPWSEFAAFAILFSAPVSLVYFFFQRYIVGGLAIGGVKG
jgi:arabinogalactan oligomer / maltooligosaccharide transport system permease protein